VKKNAYDIVIIGGGIIGCALAFELAKRGRKDILVIEKNYLSSGATGRCGAGIRQQWGTVLNATLARDSTRIFEHLEEYTGYEGNCGLNQGGYLFVAHTTAEWTQFQKNLVLQHSLDIPSIKLTPQEAKELVPHLNTEGLFGATFCQTDGHADPFHCTFAYAKGAEKMGVEIATYTEVTGLRVAGDKITGVETSKGYVETATVINATGYNASKITQMAGLDVPVFPERHQILITEPVNRIQDPMVVSLHYRFYCQQTPHGSFIMGIGDPTEPVSYNINASWKFLEDCATQVTGVLPILKNIRIVRHWAGLYDMSPDRNPIIDEMKGVSGFYTAAGFSGHGFMVAPKIAILIAQKLTGEKMDIDLRLFSSDRYETGELLLEPSVV
jgi:sarcosine oxidase subunit beta